MNKFSLFQASSQKTFEPSHKAVRLRGLNIALVAQLDRVLASEAKGRGFDSRRARHIPRHFIPQKALTPQQNVIPQTLNLKHNGVFNEITTIR